ncbi:MAG: DUF1836 domain-containing protein [Defluviitaleaceae bacterium]|nr:DUF1836 domain-containing protein [Defluviitaleaceae bacterium]MCL2275352.1 DUF1836 domain-containing protein [Defluviitaleaceae bacterium]
MIDGFNDPLVDIHHYSPTLNIAQLLTFSERKGLGITRAMVQNYIRDGLLPPPKGRIYTRKHLAALVMIQQLKAVYDMPTIKAVLVPYMDGEGLPLETYARLTALREVAQDKWAEAVAPTFAGESAGQLAEMAWVAGYAAFTAGGAQ